MTRYKLNTDVIEIRPHNRGLIEVSAKEQDMVYGCLCALGILVPVEETVVKNGYIGKFNGYVTDDRPLFSKDKPPVEEKKCCWECNGCFVGNGKPFCDTCPCHKETLNPYDVRVEPTTDKEEWGEADFQALFAGYYSSQNKIREFIHRAEKEAVQKSRKDWLREEIERLERMKRDRGGLPYKVYAKEDAIYNEALSDIQDHYKKELNQK